MARNPTTSPEALSTLARDPDDLVRAHVVENPSTRPEAIQKMAEDRSLRVMDALSRSPRTPPQRLTAFAKAWRPELREQPFWLQLVGGTPLPPVGGEGRVRGGGATR